MITKNSKNSLKNYFFLHPTSRLRLRQIERATNLSFPSVVRYVKELVDESFLKSQSISGVVFYSANRSSQHFRFEKRNFNIDLFLGSTMMKYLEKTFPASAIVLFGSFFKGEDVESSDVDIFIQSSKKIILPKNISSSFHLPIQIFSASSLIKLSNPHLANNIVNGLTIQGSLEVF